MRNFKNLLCKHVVDKFKIEQDEKAKEAMKKLARHLMSDERNKEIRSIFNMFDNSSLDKDLDSIVDLLLILD